MFTRCLAQKHELESIAYQQKDDYSAGCPPVDIIHCATHSEDIAVCPSNPEDRRKLSRWFSNWQIVSTEEYNAMACRIPAR